MTTAACSKWRGLFSVGEELSDEDLLESDWTLSSAAGPSTIPSSTATTAPSVDVQQVSLARFRDDTSSDCSASHISEPSPVKALRSLNSSHSVPHVPVPLQTPLGLPVPPPNFPSVQLNPSLNIFQKPSQDDFDDWDVDLAELDECVPQKANASVPDSVSQAKRMRLSPVKETFVGPSLRGFCNTTPTSRPPQSFIRSPCPSMSAQRGNVQPVVSPQSGPTCRLSTPVTPGPIRATPQWQRGALFHAVSPAPSSTCTPRSLNTPILTNHLVQLVSAASKTPQRPRSDVVRPKTRRFPGPAGALPQQISGRNLEDIVVTVPQTPAHGAVARLRNEVSNSQVCEEEEFGGGPWAVMKAEMGLDERNPSCFLHSYSIVMVLRKAALRQLPKNKVPNMAVVLKSILHTHADAKAVFKDTTGEMQGTVHRRLLEDRQVELKTGAVLLLKQVGVFSPSCRNHYLNVTPNNLLRIYPADGSVHSSTQPSLPVMGPAGLVHTEPSRTEAGPVSQMELHFDEDEEEQVPAYRTSSVNDVNQSTSGAEGLEDAPWGADDLDELLGEIPVDTYSA